MERVHNLTDQRLDLGSLGLFQRGAELYHIAMKLLT